MMRPDERAAREKTIQFVEKWVRPTAEEDDAKSLFRRELFDEAAKLGLHALCHPVEYGGGGGSHHAYYAFLEEIGRGSLALSVAVSVTNLVQGALSTFGTEAQKQKFLVPLAQGKHLGAFSLSEPQSGSDAASLHLSARRKGAGYVLNGAKLWCSNAGFADTTLVMARTSDHKTKGITSFLVSKDTPGFRTGKFEKKLGLRASTLAEIVFEDCFIPEDQLLGKEGEGFSVALSQLDAGRIAIGAAGIAAAAEALERCWKRLYSHPEGLPIEGIKQTLGGHFGRLLAARSLLFQAATLRDEREEVTAVASALKLFASDLAVQICNDAVHWMGYEGCVTGSGVERLLRDSKALQIVEGTNQIQQLVLARHLDEILT